MPSTEEQVSGVFVGFGFGPIQSALFVLEAQKSGNFSRFVIAEVDPVLVEAVNRHGGTYTVNVAGKQGIEQVKLSNLTLCNPNDADGRARLIEAISRADEAATALPSIRFFDRGGQASVARLLAEGLERRATDRPLLIYAAENHNHAAEELTGLLHRHLHSSAHDRFDVVNTVIGKMSGVITDSQTIEKLKLSPIVPDVPRAVLVEAFNRILISRPSSEGLASRIPVFVPKHDLLPFEEAKLYGHNAIHALLGYLASQRGYTVMSDCGDDRELMDTARQAFLDESGAGLLHRYQAHDDPLFTCEGWRGYAEDLLTRMTSPYLNDLVERVIRDPRRKLGYHDRLFGPMRAALEAGVRPVILAQGAACALKLLIDQRQEHDGFPDDLDLTEEGIGRSETVGRVLTWLWGQAMPDQSQLVELICEARSAI